MSIQKIYSSSLESLNGQIIESYLKTFLCDDSELNYPEKIIAHSDFKPDSFTIMDRFFSPTFLPEEERCETDYIRNLVSSKIQLAENNQFFYFDNPAQAEEFLFEQVMFFLTYKYNGTLLGDEIYNQELSDIVDRIFAYCIFKNPEKNILLHTEFSKTASNIIPIVVENYLTDITDSKLLLKFSIASGLIGLDLKGAQCCASQYCQTGIPLERYLHLDINQIGTNIYRSLSAVAKSDLSIDYWDELLEDIKGKDRFNLIWFPDDFIETMFDLLLISSLLRTHENLHITLVPKQGQYGNDVSIKDINYFMDLPLYKPLKSYEKNNRFNIHTSGPKMGAMNLRKLSSALVDTIHSSDALYIKGCRMHEMIQGGINKKSYTAFVAVRLFTEAETGFDARDSIMSLIKLEPGEYTYWGFKGRGKRKKTFADGREIGIVYSTSEDHEKRLNLKTPEAIADEILKLRGLQDTVIENVYQRQYQSEIKMLTKKLSEITEDAYEI